MHVMHVHSAQQGRASSARVSHQGYLSSPGHHRLVPSSSPGPIIHTTLAPVPQYLLHATLLRAMHDTGVHLATWYGVPVRIAAPRAQLSSAAAAPAPTSTNRPTPPSFMLLVPSPKSWRLLRLFLWVWPCACEAWVDMLVCESAVRPELVRRPSHPLLSLTQMNTHIHTHIRRTHTTMPLT